MKVTTHHLTADAARTDSSPRDQSLGEMTPEQLGPLLERFRNIDPVRNHELEPHLDVQTATNRFIVRTSVGKLYLYDGRDTSQAAIELDVSGLLAVFAGNPAASRMEPAEVPLDLPPSHRSRQALGTLLLAVGAAINAWAVYAFYKPEPAPPAPVYQPITDPGDLARLRGPLAGTYATGNNPGDRLIVLGQNDSVLLQVLEADHTLRSETLPGTLVRLEGQLAIALPAAGFIQVQADNSLLYFGDTYRPAPRK